MDNLTKEQRRKNMQSIKSSDSKSELLLRQKLWNLGYRYRRNYTKLIGKPDIVFVKSKIAVFIDGEFWHGFEWDKNKLKLDTNKTYWIKKIERNIERDKEVNTTLTKAGWRVLRFWEKDIKKDITQCLHLIIKELEHS